MRKKLASVFMIAFILNSIENILLLGYFSVPIAKNSIISASIFALVFTSIYDKIKKG